MRGRRDQSNPSSIEVCSANTCRLDSWWIENRRWLDDRITARVGHFAGQDFYGTHRYAASFIFEPMGNALGYLFTTFESLYATDPSILNTCAYRSEENGFEDRRGARSTVP